MINLPPDAMETFIRGACHMLVVAVLGFFTFSVTFTFGMYLQQYAETRRIPKGMPFMLISSVMLFLVYTIVLLSWRG